MRTLLLLEVTQTKSLSGYALLSNIHGELLLILNRVKVPVPLLSASSLLRTAAATTPSSLVPSWKVETVSLTAVRLFSSFSPVHKLTNLFPALRGPDFYQPKYNAIVNATNCTQAIDTLDCLRHVPFSTINAAINTTNATTWYPTVDGDFIQRYPSIQLAAGDFLHVPIISGTAPSSLVSSLTILTPIIQVPTQTKASHSVSSA